MKRIVLTMLTLSTMALYSCGEKEAETKEEVSTEEVENAEVASISGTYNVNEGSVVTWNARHYKDAENVHQGTVAIEAGTIVIENNNVVGGTFSMDMTQIIEPGTDTTEDWTLQGHFKMPDFFDVANFGTSSFTIANVTDGVVNGSLEIKGLSKDISFPAEISVTEEGVHTKAEFELNLLQFELPILLEGDTLPEEEKLESPNPTVTFQLDISASK